jgi:hypothetical protein
MAGDLTAEADAGCALGGQAVFLGEGEGVGFAGDKFDAAGGAAGITAAGVKLVLAGLVGEGEDEAFSFGYVEFADAFDN